MTPTQAAEIVAAVLETEQVATDDNFFEIGGNSLLALTLIERLKDTTGVSLPLIEVVRHPTPDGLAEAIGSQRATAGA
jgi:acyl carrier protein